MLCSRDSPIGATAIAVDSRVTFVFFGAIGMLHSYVGLHVAWLQRFIDFQLLRKLLKERRKDRRKYNLRGFEKLNVSCLFSFVFGGWNKRMLDLKNSFICETQSENNFKTCNLQTAKHASVYFFELC